MSITKTDNMPYETYLFSSYTPIKLRVGGDLLPTPTVREKLVLRRSQISADGLLCHRTSFRSATPLSKMKETSGTGLLTLLGVRKRHFEALQFGLEGELVISVHLGWSI